MSAGDQHESSYDDVEIEVTPLSTERLIQSGLDAYGVGDVEHAVRLWREVLQIDPGHPVVIDYLDSAGFPPSSIDERDVAAVPSVLEELDTDRYMTIEVDDPPPPSSPVVPRRSSLSSPVIGGEISSDHLPPRAVVVESPIAVRDRPASRRFIGLALLAGAAAALLATVGWKMAGSPEPEPSLSRGADAPDVFASPAQSSPGSASVSTFEVKVDVKPSNARLILNGTVLESRTTHIVLPADGRRHLLRVEAGGFEPQEFFFANSFPVQSIELEAKARRGKTRRANRKRHKSADDRERQASVEVRERQTSGEVSASSDSKQSSRPSRQQAPPYQPQPASDIKNPWND